MKSLKDTIYEKLKVDDIVLEEKFPMDGNFDEIIDFLTEQGFKEVPNSTGNTISKILNKESNKCFINYNNDTIWFADTTKKEVSDDNPIFLIEKWSKVSSFSVFTPYKVIVEKNKKAFIKELNKRFGWQ